MSKRYDRNARLTYGIDREYSINASGFDEKRLQRINLAIFSAVDKLQIAFADVQVCITRNTRVMAEEGIRDCCRVKLNGSRLLECCVKYADDRSD